LLSIEIPLEVEGSFANALKKGCNIFQPRTLQPQIHITMQRSLENLNFPAHS
jgi:hypothetical protein